MKNLSRSQKNFPGFITHYARGEPFRSMTNMPVERWPEVIKELNETNAWGLSRFSDPEYLTRRLVVEDRIRREFLAKGGCPELNHPIYFFLGRHDGFEKREHNRGYMIDLGDLPPNSISFTYGDSMLGLNEDYRLQSGPGYRSPLCGKVYVFKELEDLHTQVDSRENARLHIEAQLWVMPPIKLVKLLTR